MKNRKAVPEAIASGNKEQKRQLKRNALQQVANPKQKIHDIQQQSLKAMHESIDNFFNTRSQEEPGQLEQYEEETLSDVNQLPLTAELAETTYEYLEPEEYHAAPEKSEAGEQAMEIANKGVEDAMRSAMQSVEQAEKAVSGLGK